MAEFHGNTGRIVATGNRVLYGYVGFLLHNMCPGGAASAAAGAAGGTGGNGREDVWSDNVATGNRMGFQVTGKDYGDPIVCPHPYRLQAYRSVIIII